MGAALAVRRRGTRVLAWGLWALTMLALPAIAWFDHLLRQSSTLRLTWLNAENIPTIASALSAATVGALLATRRPRHPVGWLLLALALLVPASGLAYGYVRYGVMVRPGALPAAGHLAGASNSLVALWLACASLVALLTPTGTLPSPRWRWWAIAAASALAVLVVSMTLDPHPLYPEDPTFENPLSVPALRGILPVMQAASGAVVLTAPLVVAASLVVRYRRARGLERQQLRWVVFGAALAGVAIVVGVAGAALGQERVAGAAAGTSVALLPLAIGAAILRYRLYDLDRIISRTLAYGLLTMLLGGGYAVLVLALGQRLGRSSPLVVAGATLAAAAAFQPARRRVQGAVDRRFNRRHHDAARTIEAFSSRLRQHLDLDALTAELLAAVDQTMQPTTVSLWLRPPARAPGGP